MNRQPPEKIRLVALLALSVLLLPMIMCTRPSKVGLVCRDWGGHMESRPLLDGSSGTVAACVFEGGTECYGWQFYDGTCTPPGADAPVRLTPEWVPPADYNPMMAPYFGYFSPPPSLDELVGQAALIFIGEVGPVEQYLEVIGYNQETGQLQLPDIDADGRRREGTPVTDFRL